MSGVVIPHPSKKRRQVSKLQPEIIAPPNALRLYTRLRNPDRPQAGQTYRDMATKEVNAWAQDFTYLWLGKAYYYLAAVEDLKTRRIVGWSLGARHSSELTYAALVDGFSKHGAPSVLHSDQGSEYLSLRHQRLCDAMKITLSCSTRSSPWENGFMEGFFSTFKREFGSFTRFRDEAELMEAIAHKLHYYNHERIHTELGTNPAAYAAGLEAPCPIRRKTK